MTLLVEAFENNKELPEIESSSN